MPKLSSAKCQGLCGKIRVRGKGYGMILPDAAPQQMILRHRCVYSIHVACGSLRGWTCLVKKLAEHGGVPAHRPDAHVHNPAPGGSPTAAGSANALESQKSYLYPQAQHRADMRVYQSRTENPMYNRRPTSAANTPARTERGLWRCLGNRNRLGAGSISGAVKRASCSGLRQPPAACGARR